MINNRRVAITLFIILFSFALNISGDAADFSLPLSNQLENQQCYAAPQNVNDIKSEKSVSDSPDEKIALYTMLLAFFTAVLAVVSIIQGVFLKRADETARIAAKAAKESADALMASNRPYLLFSEIKIGGCDVPEEMMKRAIATENFTDVDNYERNPTVGFGIKNHGKSPAFISDLRVCLKVFDKLPEAPDYGKVIDLLSVGIPIPPGETRQNERILGIDCPITESDWALIIARKKHLIVYGIVVYKDVLNLPVLYKSRFALRHDCGGGIYGPHLEWVSKSGWWEYS